MKRSRLLVVCGLLGLGICSVLALFSAIAGKPSLPVSAISTATIAASAGAGLDITRLTPTRPPARSASTSAPPSPTRRAASTSIPTAQPTVPLTPTTEPPALTQARLSRVIDGDTIDVVMDGQTVRVRLIGMDTPETNGAPICYGQEATAHTQQLIDAAGGKLWLEKDVSETDRYGRLLRYVWLTPSSGSAVGKMLDEQLVVDGYAHVSTFPPDVKYIDRFVEAERDAKAARRGLWGACERFGAPLSAPTTIPLQTTVVRRPSSVVGDGDLPYDPNGPDRDCSDFASHAEAQRFFIAAGGPAKDPHRLDGDHDGIACETLP
ncbi:MAG: thermonuclease family protein [Chloroflexota bacterium]